VHRLDVDALGSRRLIANLNGSEEGLLAHHPFALNQLELGILVCWVDLDACLEVANGILGL